MEDRDWRILQVLYEQKNITKTAQSLFVSQPALTARLRQLEQEFKTKIVYRTSKGVHFTPQGEYLAKVSSEMLLKLRSISEHVANMGGTVAGTLRIGASNYFTMYMLPQLLKLFKKQYPNVEFNVVTTWSKDVFNLVHNQELHVGFVSSDYGWQSSKQLLFEEPICIASKEEINLSKLPSLPRIDYHSDALIKAAIEKWWRENFSEPPTISMQVDKLATCKEMVANGLGYAIMPSLIVNKEKDFHKLILTDKEGQPLLRRALMLYHSELTEINIVNAFVKFVETVDFTELVNLKN